MKKRLGVCLSLLGSTFISPPVAGQLVPTVALKLVVGSPPVGGVERVDSRRSGQSPWPLPDRPVLKWRGQVPSGALGAVTDGQGAIILASLGGHLAELDRRGRSRWTNQLSGLAAGSPAVGADGRRWVLTRTGHLHTFSPEGRELSVRSLGFEANAARAHLLPLVHADLLITQGRQAHWLSTNGELSASVQLPAPILASYEHSGQVWLVTEEGDIHSWSGTRMPKLVRALGRLSGAPALTPRGTWIWSDGQHLTQTDTSAAKARQWFSLEAQAIRSAVTLTGTGVALSARGNGVFLSSRGGSVQRIALGPSQANTGPPLSPAGDSEGRLAVVDALGQLNLVDRTRGVKRVDGAACSEAVAILPLAERSLALVCSSGLVFGVGQL